MAEIVGAALAVRCAIRRMPSWRSPGYAIARAARRNRHGVQHRRGGAASGAGDPGSPKTYTKKGDSGKDVVSSSARTAVDNPVRGGDHARNQHRAGRDPRRSSWLQPTMEIYCDSAQPW